MTDAQPPSKKGRVLKIVGLVAGVLLICTCTTCGGCLWWGHEQREEAVEQRTQQLIREGVEPNEARRRADEDPYGYGTGSSGGHGFDWD
jgi:hypothetical protein